MKLTIAAIGKARRDPTATLYESYIKRIPWPVILRELEARGKFPADEALRREGDLLQKSLPPEAKLVALDARGEALGTEDFAATLAAWQDDGVRDVAFLIGGAEGLSPALCRRADLVLSFGPMIWPHLLARAMLAEQLYRAHCIMTNHPYHRG